MTEMVLRRAKWQAPKSGRELGRLALSLPPQTRPPPPSTLPSNPLPQSHFLLCFYVISHDFFREDSREQSIFSNMRQGKIDSRLLYNGNVSRCSKSRDCNQLLVTQNEKYCSKGSNQTANFETLFCFVLVWILKICFCLFWVKELTS